MNDLFKDDEIINLDISKITNDNVNKFLESNQLKLIYLISPDFGGSEEIDNQVVVTPNAYEEKKSKTFILI